MEFDCRIESHRNTNPSRKTTRPLHLPLCDLGLTNRDPVPQGQLRSGHVKTCPSGTTRSAANTPFQDPLHSHALRLTLGFAFPVRARSRSQSSQSLRAVESLSHSPTNAHGQTGRVPQAARQRTRVREQQRLVVQLRRKPAETILLTLYRVVRPSRSCAALPVNSRPVLADAVFLQETEPASPQLSPFHRTSSNQLLEAFYSDFTPPNIPAFCKP